MTGQQLTTEQAAKLAGVTPGSWREYMRRGTVPVPDGYLGRTPWWWSGTIEAWLPTRPPPSLHRSAKEKRPRPSDRRG